MYSLSISLVLYQTDFGVLKRVLHSLSDAVDRLQQRFDCDVKLIVVDNSADNTMSVTKKNIQNVWLKPFMFIPLSQNVGFGVAHNLAVEQSDSEFHLILNPDAILAVDALLNGILFLQNNSQVVLVSPYAEWETQQRQYLCKNYPSVLDLLLRGFAPDFIKQYFKGRLARYELRGITEQSELVSVPIVSGCFMLLRRVTFNQVNGFSTAYFLYFEDFDLSIRLSKLGHLAYVPSVKIIHLGGNAGKKGWKHILLFVRSMATFFNTHGWRLL